MKEEQSDDQAQAPPPKEPTLEWGDATNRAPLYWFENFRPKTLDDILGQDEITRVLKAWARSKIRGIIPPIIVLHGDPGTGKTSAANAFLSDYLAIHGQPGEPLSAVRLDVPATVFRENPHSYLRTKILPRISGQYLNSSNLDQFAILDDASNFDKSTQREILRISESWRGGHLILLTNHLNKKFEEGLLDRASGANFFFKPVAFNLLRPRLMQIIRTNNMHFVDVEKTLADAEANYNGSIRSALAFIAQAYALESLSQQT